MVSYCFLYLCVKNYGGTIFYRKEVDKMNELCHYGIKGQKWGVRRYQNPDGSLTDVGRKRAEYKINQLFKKSDKAIMKYKSYDRQYKLADAGAKEALTPAQYGRWVTSGARMGQTKRLNQLKNLSKKRTNQVKEYINKFSNYYVSYDVKTRNYSLKEK